MVAVYARYGSPFWHQCAAVLRRIEQFADLDAAAAAAVHVGHAAGVAYAIDVSAVTDPRDRDVPGEWFDAVTRLDRALDVAGAAPERSAYRPVRDFRHDHLRRTG